MKYFASILCLVCIAWSSAKLDASAWERLLQEDGRPSPYLKQLLQATAIDDSAPLDAIVAQTQSTWLRPQGSERWNFPLSGGWQLDPKSIENSPLACEWPPSQSHYRYALVLGATVSSVRVRLATLVSAWQRGCRFESIVFLTSGRPLNSEIEGPDVLLLVDPLLPDDPDWSFPNSLPSTESAMMLFLFQRAHLPRELKELRLSIVDVPMRQVEGAPVRPNTRDTIVAWLATSPAAGSCLAFSSQPFAGYQNALLRRHLPFPLETAAKAMTGAYIQSQGERLQPILLDSAARWLYEEWQQFKAENSATLSDKRTPSP